MYENYTEARKGLEKITEIIGPYDPELLSPGREGYLNWVRSWKIAYRDLSRAIRELKAARKSYRYKYRDKGDQASQKRTKIGRNPNHNSEAAYYLPMFRVKAREMMEWREEAKVLSRKLKAESLEQVA